jgi:23S rRNA pseudouridine1911/1915/1917 synthase
VHNTPPHQKEIITHWLRRDEKKNFTKAFDEEVSHGSKAQLEYELIETKGRFSLLKIRLLTGRKHQIRAQLSYIGCPIEGDMKYGAPAPKRDQSISLHSLQFKVYTSSKERRNRTDSPFKN